ncbi:MAG TPA: phosphoserine phosphatase SerB [Sphingomonadaceae bacterium]|nr:phosphoserine phosphatase SerB [Sphingomonadaceae bacterium]
MFIATVVASETLTGDHLAACSEALRAHGLEPGTTAWVEPGRAGDVRFAGDPLRARAVLEPLVATFGGDVIVQAEAVRMKRLLVADMDSTMITVECIDELADYAGIKPQVAAVTEQAMRGEIPFEAALRARVALLRGLDVGVLAQCLAERVRMMPGAAELVGTMRARGAATLLVSGGFTAFAEPVAAVLGFEVAIANVLGVEDGRLTGTLVGPIVDAGRKATALAGARERLGLTAADVLAVGDGANDLPMVRVAGLGVAFKAKPVLREAAGASIVRGDLTALLYAQGYAKADWRVWAG